jgi:hypothetical protein
MSHQDNWMEYGKPMADGCCTAVEIFDKNYGVYSSKDKVAPSGAMNGLLDPKPFGNMSDGK